MLERDNGVVALDVPIGICSDPLDRHDNICGDNPKKKIRKKT